MPKLKILVDECLDRRLALEIPDFYVRTVVQMGWSGLKNGKLLTNAQELFDIFVTSDRNLSFQQNLTKYKIAVIVLCPKTDQLDNLKLLVPSLLKALSDPKVGQAEYIR